MTDVAYTPRQAMRFLSVSRSTLYRWVREGLLPARQLPSGHHRFLESDLRAMLESRPKIGRPQKGDGSE